MWHVWGYFHARFQWGNLRVGDHLINLGVEERIILACDFK